MSPPRRSRAGPLAALAAMLAVGVGVAFTAPRIVPGEVPEPEPELVDRTPAPTPALPEAVASPTPDDEIAEAEDVLLQERLGGLASLVVPDTAAIEDCARPAEVPDVGETHGIDALVALTEQLRDLDLDEQVDVELLTPDEMAAEVEERFAARGDPEVVEREARILVALGAITPDTDLGALRVEAFAEQVSGLHAGNDGVVFVRVDGEELSPLERTVVVHEIEHALTHQQLGRPSEHRDDEGEHADERLASLAVIEGSATLSMLQYARSLLDDDEQALLREELLARAFEDALGDYTPYLLSELRFPYTEGLAFACARWREGGWAAVDETYTTPPASTAEVLFPDRDEAPATPERLGELGPPWERARTTVLGAAQLLWLLEAPGGDRAAALDDPRARVAAWGGGRLVLWTDGPASAVGVAFVDHGAGPPLCETVRDWYAAAYPEARERDDGDRVFRHPDQDAVLRCEGAQVRLGIAPDVDTARILVE